MLEDDELTTESKSGPYTILANKENELFISYYKIKDENLKVSISAGTIVKKGEGKYSVTVKDTNRVLIELYNIKKNKMIASTFFDVIKK